MKQQFDKPLISSNPIFRMLTGLFYHGFVIPILFLIDHLFFGMRVRGRKQLKKVKGSGAVVVCNHIHNFDCTFLGMLCWPRKPVFTGMEELFGWPVVGRLIHILGCVPVPRSVAHTRQFLDEMAAAARDENRIICVYPEGELIAYCPALRGFKDGAFTIAARAGVPVVPAIITQEKPRGILKLYKRKPCLTVHAGEPVYPQDTGSTRQTARQLRDEVYARMSFMQRHPIRHPQPEDQRESA
ncbi:lysophospholipid acyltransferase family protein [Candidatus Soleaferrea massiliensis]|uniref:lysophospholipid acyltransferase family protein n=1 Tax=Candidatus Soleaferrea massiliensis TaxID=1470354 RepID=UPI00058BDBC4|nr:lysophospholipid acyltransferase family protein [Candidatus Soleaferrea massiliensis]